MKEKEIFRTLKQGGSGAFRSLYIIFFSKPKENKNEATKVRLFSNVDFEFSREEKLRSLF
jgi:hypothetical protein